MSFETHIKGMELTQAYAEAYPEVKELVESIMRASKHRNTMCKITIGKYHEKNESFEVRLVSNIRFVNVLFSSIGNEPIVYLRNNSRENILMINLVGVESILHKGKRILGKPLNSETEEFIFSYRGVDYKIVFTYDMKYTG